MLDRVEVRTAITPDGWTIYGQREHIIAEGYATSDMFPSDPAVRWRSVERGGRDMWILYRETGDTWLLVWRYRR